MKYDFLTTLSVRKLIVSLLLFPATSVFAPVALHGAYFSVMSGFGSFGGLLNRTAQSSEAAESPFNSQTVPLLRAASHTDPNPAKGGGDITIVDGALLSETGPAGTLADIEEREQYSTAISLYVVRKGDTLSGIAKMFNVSVNTIRWANELSSGVLKEGQTLVILPVSGVRHTIGKGETLASIAKKYKGDINEITNYNGLAAGSTLAAGDVIIIPDGEIAAPRATVRSAPLRGAGGPSIAGYYINPIPGGRKTQGLHGYNGIDLGAPPGTPIYASASGVVIVSRSSGWNGGYGVYVVISHGNGTQTLYAHNSRNIVGVGDYVSQGQVIGYIGSTGKSTGAHLHFEVRGARNPF